MITMGPFKRAAYPQLGFAWADIIRPAGCGKCGWYGTHPKMHPLNGRFECPRCSSQDIKCFPGIEPDMLQ